MAVITISRQSGSLGDELAEYLSEKLGCRIISRDYALKNYFGELTEGTLERLNESAKFFLNPIPDSDKTYRDVLIARLRAEAEAASDNGIIILGLGGCVLFGASPDSVNIRIYAGEQTRCARIARRFNISTDEAASIIAIGDRKHKRFVSTLFEKDLNSAELYDLSLNTDKMSVEECAAAILSLIEKHDLRQKITSETVGNNVIDHQSELPVFKNATEEEFARILDMYNIEWLYEPKTFPIEWDAEGNIKMAFSPDFYLPKFDLYLELTTMDQKYVTKKNKKMRMVRELYPGTNIRIVYKKDFQELIERLRQFG
ncbi:MAG: cytidylate kinase family protein [Clostridiales bacterium]|nr:cytidylate kinase family protein [Clostridiales bacterium]